MEVIINGYLKSDVGTAVTIGNFDGLHIGHKKLINILKIKSKEKNLKSAVISFLKHTNNTIKKVPNSKVLINHDQKVISIEKTKVDFLYLINFTTEIMQLNPEEFVREILVNRLNVKLVIIGFNFRFGFKAKGNTETLVQFGYKYGFEVIIVSPMYYNDKVVSSTYIRELIKNGNIITANKLLEREFSLVGNVVKGKSIGKKIGFPTANITLLDDYVVPKKGIYKTKTIIDDRIYNSVTSIGNNPTFGNNDDISIETHILDFNKDIYDKKIEIKFIEFLRDEIKFRNVNDLIEQIKKDIIKVKIG